VSAAVVAVAAAAGLAAGPWQRAAIFTRSVPSGQPPRSGCPLCGAGLPGRSRALAPSGRCGACRGRIGPPPLTVEVTSAVVLGALAARIPAGPDYLALAAACWLGALGVPLAWIDATVRRLPDVLTVPAYAGTLALFAAAAGLAARWPDLLRAGLGGAALCGAYLALSFVSRGQVGIGDAKLGASVGTALAWPSWPVLLAGTVLAFVLAAGCAVVLLASRRGTLRQQVAFGPFMLAGALLALLAAGHLGP
jgi:leader peptidase (prepilin peptidase)/N-methyltransferase